VIELTTTSNRWTRRLAALLLVLQALAGGVVPLAHASERLTAPAHIEAQHGAGCLALHDSLRCGLCHYARSHGTSQEIRTQAHVAVTLERRPSECDSGAVRRLDHRLASPRAPPASRS